MAGNIISNNQSGNFTVDGAFVYEAAAQPITPVGPQTNLIGVVGTASWGPKNQQVVFSDAASLFSAFGNQTTSVNSLARTALSAMPECNNFVGVRVTDGTDAAATMSLNDTASAAILTLTANYTGSYPNGAASVRLDLQSGTLSVGPIFKLTIAMPNAQPNVYLGIVGSSTANGAYSSATFKANAIAAINGTAPNSVPNQFFTASSAASTVNPQVGNASLNTASGGADGSTSITSTILIGTDGSTGRTGMYALRGAVAGGQVLVAGLSDLSQFQNLAAFAQPEACVAHIAVGSGNTSDQVVSTKASNSAVSRFVSVNAFWDYVQDANSGQKLLVDPSAAVAGIIAGTPAWKYVGNKPYNGKLGIVATERSVLGQMSQAEMSELQTNGVQYLTNNMPRGAGLWGLPHGKASDGSNLNDTRMLNFCAIATLQVLGPFVGEMQSAQKNDPTRGAARAALSTFFQGLLSQGQIAAFQITMDTTNNTPTTVAQGFLLGNIAVQTLSGVEFALAALQVGNTVQVQVTQAA